MAQRLIVEGNDAIALTRICMRRGLNPPKGYRNTQKFKAEFVISAKGIDKVNTALIEELQSPDVTRIGVIVDANNVGVEARFDSLKNTIENILEITLPAEAVVSNQGFGYQVTEDLFIGIWIMPNNETEGYLEHFLCTLIPPENEVWNFANQKVEELMNQAFCEFTTVKKQKALLHTYLAWKESPGLPMGTAIQANYINGLSTNANDFITWFKSTFELEI